MAEDTVVKVSKKHMQHEQIKRMIKEYVENPANFLTGSRLVSEISRALEMNESTCGKNLKLMFYRGELAKRVHVIDKARFTLVFCAK
jgi:hypothetical protein